MSVNEEIRELPPPEIEGFSRSELVGVVKALMQMNRSLKQAVALALIEQWHPSLARALSRHLDRTLHPQFTEIVSAVQQPRNLVKAVKGGDNV